MNGRATRWLAQVALLLGAFSLFTTAYLYARIDSEGKNRRGQTCKLFETSHLQDVTALRSTYEYLEALSPAERRDTINVFVLRGLDHQERDAKIDAAPRYCDEPGIGLPGPDPVIPERPLSLR